jgi:hypothetical protein
MIPVGMSAFSTKRTSIGLPSLLWSLVPVLSERQRNVRINRRDFSFSRHRLAKEISAKKLSQPA